MKPACVVLLSFCLTACANHEHAEASKDSKPPVAAAAATPAVAAQGNNEMIGLSAYPGAVEMPNTRLQTRGADADTYIVFYQTPDAIAKVSAYYRAEGATLGEVGEGISIGDQLQSISIKRRDGSQGGVQARRDEKGGTVFSLHRRIPVSR
jgi:hypothetical protein